MPAEVYYIPGERDRGDDSVVDAARGRVDLGVGEAADAPPGTTALVVGPGVDPGPALKRVKALRFVQLISCDNPSVDALDLDKKSVRVASISPAVAEMVAAHAIGLAIAAVRLPEGTGMRSPGEIAQMAADKSALAGMQVGIIGLGTLGGAVARRLAGSGAKLVYADLRTAPRRNTSGLGIRRQTLDLLLTQSDVIVVAARWGPTANPLVGARELRLPDPGAVLVNAADSRLADDSALHGALSSGQLKGAGMGISAGRELGSLPNVVTSPLEMTAVASEAAAELVVSNLERFANDEPVAGLVEPIDYPPAGDPAFWSSRLYPHRTG